MGPSNAGSELGGTFTLNYRGHVTSPIAYDASSSVVKSSLEALQNINEVELNRAGPTTFQEYTWLVTFLSMPGSYLDGTENVHLLVPNYANLGGTVAVATTRSGSDPPAGTYSVFSCHDDAQHHQCRDESYRICPRYPSGCLKIS